MGNVRGEGGSELYTLGGLSGELQLLYGKTGRYPQVDVSQCVCCACSEPPCCFWFITGLFIDGNLVFHVDSVLFLVTATDARTSPPTDPQIALLVKFPLAECVLLAVTRCRMLLVYALSATFYTFY